ncbi:MAG: hypothetical protein KTR19_11400 [Hyphomicrobiales bacterium]|nr:hypothetical protein [Hyphomicrobiales bacterium]
MVRSTAGLLMIGAAVAASAFPAEPLRAQTGERLTEQSELPPDPVEQKAVPVEILPAANEAAFDNARPDIVDQAPIIIVQPAKNSISEILLEPEETEETASGESIQTTERVALLPPVDETPEASEDSLLNDVGPEPAFSSEADAREEIYAPVERPVVAARPEATWEADETSAAIFVPSLPERSPLRQFTFKSEIVENKPVEEERPTQISAIRQVAPEPVPEKSSAAVRFLKKLLPGQSDDEDTVSEAAIEPDASETETALALPAGEDADADEDKPTMKRILDGIQFWK